MYIVMVGMERMKPLGVAGSKWDAEKMLNKWLEHEQDFRPWDCELHFLDADNQVVGTSILGGYSPTNDVWSFD